MNELNQNDCRHRRFQWSVNTLLWMTATVAFLCGAVVAANSMDSPRPSGGKWFTSAAAILVIYCWRFRLVGSGNSRATNIISFTATLLVLLPYIYVFAGLIADWARLPISKWLGDPVWVFAVPVASFAIFDLRQKHRSVGGYLCRSGLELFLFFPIWTFVWLAVQGYFDWWQM